MTLSDEERYKRLWKAAYKIYSVGKWTTDAISDKGQDRLFEELRDALGLPAGYATLTGIHDKWNPVG